MAILVLSQPMKSCSPQCKKAFVLKSPFTRVLNTVSSLDSKNPTEIYSCITCAASAPIALEEAIVESALVSHNLAHTLCSLLSRWETV